MAEQLPRVLAEVLRATDTESREVAWEQFIDSYSPLLLHVAQSMARGYDNAMDRYTFVLGRLRDHDYERLRCYAVQPRSEFTTWLVVVARRLCLDFHRHQYGRLRGRDSPAGSYPIERKARQRLVDAAFDPPDVLARVASGSDDPAAQFERAERRAVLAEAIASLAPTDQLLLKLRFEDELSARTIAAVLSFPTPFQVYRRLQMVLADLRVRLDGTRTQAGPHRPS